MANYMSEVAKMLGVELGEEFKIYGSDGTYLWVNTGLFDVDAGTENKKLLYDLLTGQRHIIGHWWTPSKGDMFSYVAKDGKIYSELWEGTTFNIMLYKINNCYKSKTEAEWNRDKWITFYASDEVLEV